MAWQDDVMSEPADPGAEETSEEELEEYRVTPLELFFDLVFVFALTQVTALVAHDLTWLGLLRGLAVLMAVWWAWVGYSWLTNAVPVDEDDRARVVMLLAMTSMLVLALSIPNAFGDDGVLFGITYLIVTALFVALYLLSTHDRPEMHQAVHRLAPGVLVAPVLIAVAGFLDPGPLRASLWAIALIVTFSAGVVAGTSGWEVRPGHFAERHGLIVIIALGESLVALGIAASHDGTALPVIVAASMGVVVISCLWWLYFDVVAFVGELRLRKLFGRERNALARDSYSYIHLVIVAGIIMVALGLKSVLRFGNESLPLVAAVTLFGGVAIYLIGHAAFRWRNLHTVNPQRWIVGLTLLALITVSPHISAYLSLLLVTLVTVGLVAYEAIRFRELRKWVRANH